MRLEGLDLNLVIALEAILRLRSVSAAAAETHLTQPALSRSLGRLRAHFGDPIVLLSGRELVLTEFGAAIHPFASRLLNEARTFTQMRAVFDPGVETREFSIICSDYITLTLLAPMLGKLAAQAPQVTLRCISIDTSADVAFARGDIDFRVIPEYILSRENPFCRLFEDSFVSVVWSGNSRVGETLDMETFLALRHVATAFGSNRFGSHLEQFLSANRIDLDVAMLVPNFSHLPDCVVGTPYIATIHRRLAARLPRDAPLRLVETPIPIPPLVQNLEWHPTRDGDKASIWLRHLLIDEAARFAPSD
ncbi:MAG: LysR family transcriptional regulator [Rhodobacteraceae bacterium]|nr:LysR family transcriptional regulator [Paracoccaceae bacterium]